jgi:hypothetical protein
MLAPPWRKLALTAHVVASVGWLGAVLAFLSLAVAGLTGTDASVVRAAYISSKTITWAVIVPLSFATLITGAVQGLVTPWGLFRHWWVVAKLAIAVAATVLLLLHARSIDEVALAAARAMTAADLPDVRRRLVFDAALAAVALVAATILSIYKPAGTLAATRPRPLLLALLVIAIVLVVVRHFSHGGFSH